MGKKIKVLVFVKHIDGGTGTFVSQILKLNKLIRNLKIEIIVLGKQKYRPVYPKQFVVHYFKSSLYPDYYQFNLHTILLCIHELFWIKKKVQKIQPDVILSIDAHCSILASVLKTFFFLNIKLIVTIHNNLSAVVKNKLSKPLQFILKVMGNCFLQKSDHIVGISNEISKETKKFFKLNKDIVTVPYGIDINKTNILSNVRIPKSETEIFVKNSTRLISIGRFEIQKDFITLIKAFNIVRKDISNCELILIGDGYDKKRLINLTKKLNLTNSVYFSGWKNNVFPYLKRSDIFVLSSFYEGFGWVLLEAMSQGLPVISTDTPFGPAEVLDNGKYGILVPVGDEKVMAQAMYELLTNEKKYNYYARKSLERAKYFSLDKMLNAYKKVILDLVKKS